MGLTTTPINANYEIAPSPELCPKFVSSCSGSHSGNRTSSIRSFLGNKRVLSTLSVVCLCYFNVSGGPIGSETIIGAGGPLVGIVSILLIPFVWCVPVALVTAELSAAFPDDGGYIVWVFHAFGPFLAFQEGYWSWISGVIDNALYPALAVDSILRAYGGLGSLLTEYLVKAGIAIALTIPGLYGIKIVGNGMFILTIVVMLPFIVLTCWGLVNADFSILLQVRHEDMDNATRFSDGTGPLAIQWKELINVLFWNFNGFHGMSVFAGEVANPQTSYPRALCIATVLIILTYLFPLSISAAVNAPLWHTWDESSFPNIAYEIGGRFLQGWVLIASLFSNAGQYMTELFVDSFQLLGMAESGLVPAFLAKRHAKYHTPQRAIFSSLVIILGLVAFDFSDILVITNVLSSISVVLMTLTAIKLRMTFPDTPRPFKVPGGIHVLVLMSIAPTILALYITITSFESIKAMIIIAISIGGGIVLYFFQVWSGQFYPEKFLDIERMSAVPSHTPLQSKSELNGITI